MLQLRILFVALVCCASLALALSTAPASARSAHIPTTFANGAWQLWFSPSFHYQLNGAGFSGSADWRMSGTGSMLVRDEQVVRGSHEMTGGGGGDLQSEEGSGTLRARMAIVGRIDGTATEAYLKGETQFSGMIEADVRGTSFTHPITNSGVLSPPAQLQPFSVSCDLVTGTFTLAHEEIARAEGIDVSGEGTFVATRAASPTIADDSATDLGRKVLRLLEDLGAATERAASGRIDIGRIVPLMERAEQLHREIAELERSPEPCRAEGPWFTNVIGPAVANLLDVAAARADDLTADKVARLVSAGLRSGALGPSAGAGRELEAKYRLQMETLLDRAIEARDGETVSDIGLIARELGWDDIAEKALDSGAL